MQEKNTIKGQIDALNDQIDDISAQIVEKEQQITDKQAEIDQKQAEYDDRWAKYKEQVVSMQMLDQGGGIALLSTAENIYQLLTFDQVLQDISDANTQACEDLEQQGIELTNERTQLEEAKASLEADEEELQNQKSQLDSKPRSWPATFRPRMPASPLPQRRSRLWKKPRVINRQSSIRLLMNMTLT